MQRAQQRKPNIVRYQDVVDMDMGYPLPASEKDLTPPGRQGSLHVSFSCQCPHVSLKQSAPLESCPFCGSSVELLSQVGIESLKSFHT